ncbi:MAG: alpha amylase [Clostridia bacterium]|nr:alpha amylase [Clostridia bacterium]
MIRRGMAALLLMAVMIIAAGAAQAEAYCNWYEVFVRSYQDSDGDGIGDLNGLRSRLDYIEEMGYTGLWLMPVMPSPSYHKYDVTDYYGIDPEYGTLEDMRALVEDCHARGIRLIIDLPVNHSSSQHPWFLEACEALRSGDTDNPRIGWYGFTKEAGQKTAPVAGTDWHYEEQFSGGGMPDLNLENEAVLAEIEKIMAFWLQDVGVDGFRLDAVTSYFASDTDRNVAFLAWLNDTAEALRPGCFIVGEAWVGLTEIARYYESGIDSFFLFPASQAEGYIAKALRSRTPAKAYMGYMEDVRAAIPEGVLAPFLGNHDTGRAIASLQARKNPEKAKFAEAMLNMMGGATFTYYGEEIGMVGAGDDPNKRLAMYWNDGDMTQQPPGVTRLEYAYPCADEQMADETSLLAYCRALNRAKLAHPAIARGENSFVYGDSYVIIMRRVYGGETCYVAMNFDGKQARTAALDWANPTMMEQINVSGNVSTLDQTGGGAVLTLAPYGVVILH